MELTTTAFKPGGRLPAQFTADGPDQSPPLTWSGAPDGTRAFALIMEDPDAPRGLWIHWVVFDLPATVSGLEGDVPRTATLGNGGRQGNNTWGRLGWNGPAPPPGKPHRYAFRIFALSAPLDLQAGTDAAGVKAAMKGKVLAEGSLTASYGR